MNEPRHIGEVIQVVMQEVFARISGRFPDRQPAAKELFHIEASIDEASIDQAARPTTEQRATE